jgi:hypothetical protein
MVYLYMLDHNLLTLYFRNRIVSKAEEIFLLIDGTAKKLWLDNKKWRSV